MKIDKKKLSNYIFLCAYFIMHVCWYMIRIPVVKQYFNYIKIFCIVLLLINCIFQSRRYKKNTVFKIFLLIVLNFIIYYKSKSDVTLTLTLLLLSMKNIEKDRLIKFDVFCKIFTITILYIMESMNLLNDTKIIERDGIVRQYMGFSHPNIFGFVFTSLIIDLIYINKNHKTKWYSWGIILFSTLLLYYYVNSRASILILLMAFGVSIIKKEKIAKLLNIKGSKFFISNCWIIMTVLTLIMALLYYYKTDIGLIMNNISNTRIGFVAKFMTENNINLFGQEIYLTANIDSVDRIGPQVILDNTYVHYLLRYGLLFYGFISIYFNKFFKWAYKEKDYLLIVIMALYIVYMMMECRLNTIVYVLLLGKVFYEENETESNGGSK